MKIALFLAVLGVALINVNALKIPPKVQVYSRNPGTRGLSNKLICHVSGFHPADISIQLLENGEEIPGAKQTDLAFEQSWLFHLTRSVPFTPAPDRQYSCRVKHIDDPIKEYTWEPDM